MEEFWKTRRKGLQTKGKFMLVLFPLMVVSLVAMTVQGIFYVRASTKNALEQSLYQTAEICAGRVTDRIEANVELATSLASRLGSLYVSEISDEYNAVAAEDFQDKLTVMGDAYGFLHMYVVDLEGFIRSGIHTRVAGTGAAFYQAILDGADYFMTDPSLDSSKFVGKYTMNIAVPIHNDDDHYIGMLVCKVDASELSQLVTDASVGEDGATFIMDGLSRCIAHKNQNMLYGSELLASSPDNQAGSDLNRLYSEMVINDNGYMEYSTIGDGSSDAGGKRLAAYTKIDDSSNWALAVTVSEREFMRDANRAAWVFALIALFLIGVCSTVISFFVNHIVNRIERVSLNLETLAQGDLGITQLTVGSNDEIGRLEAASNKLKNDLQEVINRIEVSLEEIAQGNLLAVQREPLNGDFAAIDQAIIDNKRKLGELILNLARTATEVSRGSEQMANGAASLAQGAAEQASSVEELFTSVTDVSQKAIALGGVTTKTMFVDEDASLLSEESLESAENLTGKLRFAMERISDACQSVRKLASGIDSISSETSMLALNASVEATHAGEFGKGFAVIASEVRALAEKSREAAKTADTQIDSIMATVDRGSRTVEYTVAAVDDMASAISQFKNALEQISDVIESTAATAEETATNSEELSQQAGVLREMIADFTYDSELL